MIIVTLFQVQNAIPNINRDSFLALKREVQRNKGDKSEIANELLQDSRFGAMFDKSEFDVDKETEIYRSFDMRFTYYYAVFWDLQNIYTRFTDYYTVFWDLYGILWGLFCIILRFASYFIPDLRIIILHSEIYRFSARLCCILRFRGYLYEIYRSLCCILRFTV